MQADLSPRAGIGPVLRRAREARGLSLDAAARSTMIRPRYLAALEDDAGADAFPGPIYARFFLKEYARYLGVDEAPLVVALEEREPPPVAPLRLVAELEPPRRWVGRVIRVAAVVSMLALVVYAVAVSSSEPSATPAPGARSQLMDVPAFPPRPHALSAAPSGDPDVRAVVRVLEPTRLTVFVDGDKAVKRTVQPRRLVFRARAGDRRAPTIEIEAADGAAVRLVVDGRVIPTEHRAPFHARFVRSFDRTVRL